MNHFYPEPIRISWNSLSASVAFRKKSCSPSPQLFRQHGILEFRIRSEVNECKQVLWVNLKCSTLMQWWIECTFPFVPCSACRVNCHAPSMKRAFEDDFYNRRRHDYFRFYQSSNTAFQRVHLIQAWIPMKNKCCLLSFKDLTDRHLLSNCTKAGGSTPMFLWHRSSSSCA